MRTQLHRHVHGINEREYVQFYVILIVENKSHTLVGFLWSRFLHFQRPLLRTEDGAGSPKGGLRNDTKLENFRKISTRRNWILSSLKTLQKL